MTEGVDWIYIGARKTQEAENRLTITPLLEHGILSSDAGAHWGFDEEIGHVIWNDEAGNDSGVANDRNYAWD